MTGTDTYLGDPMIGVPTVWPYSGSGVHTHHNSEDTPETVDTRSLRDLSAVTAAYLYVIASAGEAEAPWLAEMALSRGYEELLRAGSQAVERIYAAEDATAAGRLAAEGEERIAYLAERESQAIVSVLRVAPEARREALRKSLVALLERLQRFSREQSEGLAKAAAQRAAQMGITGPVRAPQRAAEPQITEASRIIVRRKRLGTIPLDELRPDQREGYPSGAWSLVPITALYWCDGQRNLAEVIRLTRLELGATKFDFVGYFRFLQKHGYVEFVSSASPARTR